MVMEGYKKIVKWSTGVLRITSVTASPPGSGSGYTKPSVTAGTLGEN